MKKEPKTKCSKLKFEHCWYTTGASTDLCEVKRCHNCGLIKKEKQVVVIDYDDKNLIS